MEITVCSAAGSMMTVTHSHCFFLSSGHAVDSVEDGGRRWVESTLTLGAENEEGSAAALLGLSSSSAVAPGSSLRRD